MSMLDKTVQKLLSHTFAFAQSQQHSYVTLEHLLYFLIQQPTVNDALQACLVDLKQLRQQLEAQLTQQERSLQDDEDPLPTLAVQRVIERAIFNNQQQSHSQPVNSLDLMAALYHEQESTAISLLERLGADKASLLSYIAHGIPKNDATDTAEHTRTQQQARDDQHTLTHYCTHLNALVGAGKIDPIIGREKELHQISEILLRRRKNNPLLIGEAGVGKTALAEALAYAAEHDQLPESLKGAQVYSLDLAALLAGTRYRGDFEKRFKAILTQLENIDNSIVFIDEIHTIVGAGSVQGNSLDAANLLKPVLARGQIKCIGATTFEEYRLHISKDKALSRRFQTVQVAEPSISDTIRILNGLKSIFEQHHHIRYTHSALSAAAELSARYITDRHLPDKAIDLIDDLGAQEQAKPAHLRKKRLTATDVRQRLSQQLNLPIEQQDTDEQQSLYHLADELQRVIFGQNNAIQTLVNHIKLARAGLRATNKPWGSFLLTGPTGVGKTELAKQLAHHLHIPLIRFDMSEYMESHSIARLIGAPPGYVGYEKGGLLSEAILKQSHAVLLLDEIEKAHPDIFNLLLQIMDDGQLTDSHGRTINCRHLIIMMTSNLGAEERQQAHIGFADHDTLSTHKQEKALAQTFKPEFRNRLDAIIPFEALTPEHMSKVVDKHLFALENLLEQKGYHLHVSTQARSWLAYKGYDPRMGARPLERLIEQTLKQPLAEYLLFANLSKGSSLSVDIHPQEDTLTVSYH